MCGLNQRAHAQTSSTRPSRWPTRGTRRASSWCTSRRSRSRWCTSSAGRPCLSSAGRCLAFLEIGNLIEKPFTASVGFENKLYVLPLTEVCRTIRRDVRAISTYPSLRREFSVPTICRTPSTSVSGPARELQPDAADGRRDSGRGGGSSGQGGATRRAGVLAHSLPSPRGERTHGCETESRPARARTAGARVSGRRWTGFDRRVTSFM